MTCFSTCPSLNNSVFILVYSVKSKHSSRQFFLSCCINLTDLYSNRFVVQCNFAILCICLVFWHVSNSYTIIVVCEAKVNGFITTNCHLAVWSNCFIVTNVNNSIRTSSISLLCWCFRLTNYIPTRWNFVKSLNTC